MSKNANRTRSTYHVGNLAPLLLDAARRMLAEVGPTKLSLRGVSEQVGVSATAAYHHFANRNELLGELAAEGFRELSRTLSGQNMNVAREHLLRQASLAYFSFARANPALYQLMFGQEFVDSAQLPALQEARQSAYARLEAIIGEVFRMEVGAPQVRSSALASWSYIHGLASLAIHGVIQIPPEISDEHLVERTLNGLAGLHQAWIKG